jgi:hypothetical protein
MYQGVVNESDFALTCVKHPVAIAPGSVLAFEKHYGVMRATVSVLRPKTSIY